MHDGASLAPLHLVLVECFPAADLLPIESSVGHSVVGTGPQAEVHTGLRAELERGDIAVL
jgi:hypothetical protein